MRQHTKARVGFLLLLIPFLFGFIVVPYFSCGEVEITLLGRLIAGLVFECIAAVSAVIFVAGIILAFDKKAVDHLGQINGGGRVDPGR